ncbi:hypothetical protein [uncultured Mediterranean phage]|nr:hypothetical protein [uncultured Mediterranean phage]
MTRMSAERWSRSIAVGNKKFSPEIVDRIVLGLEACQSVTGICKAVGISAPTYYKWLGEATLVNPDPAKVEFLERVMAAEGEAEQGLVDVVRQKAKKDARCAQWLLARRYKWQEGHQLAKEAQKELDRLRVAKARAEIEFLEARSEALRGLDTESDEVLGLLRGLVDDPAETTGADAGLEVLRLSKAN